MIIFSWAKSLAIFKKNNLLQILLFAQHEPLANALLKTTGKQLSNTLHRFGNLRQMGEFTKHKRRF
jgi:hypothetical protein